MSGFVAFLTYAVPLSLILTGYGALKRKSALRAAETLSAATEAGLTEPQSLHPLIDPVACLGCGACASACPEGDIIGLIGGKAVLIEPTHCIGHGACAASCPTGAISLVFGTEKRGVDIPFVGPDFQTNVPGIFIAGELGGMGLIRNAVEQGRQAIDSIRKSVAGRDPSLLDVVIVGAGPAGFAATLGAHEAGLRYVTIEQEALGGAVAHYPRGKLVMTEPALLPIVGKMNLKDPSKEALLRFWEEAARRSGVEIQYEERVEHVSRIAGGLEIVTNKRSYKSKTVLLAIGRRGTPRKLGVPGEEMSKVVYRMIDPAQYQGRRVLVVGGGDSALEAAGEIADQPGSKVILSYRGEAFGRARQRNRQRIEKAAAQGTLKVALESEVLKIGEADVSISVRGEKKTARVDDVIVCAGGILPTAFLKSIGIGVETKYGTT